MDPTKEKVVGCGLVGGLVVVVVSVILMWVFSMAGVFHGTATREPITNRITDAGDLNLVPLMFSFMAIGVFMMLGAIGYGVWYQKTKNLGPRQVTPGAKVLARYAVDENGNLMTEDYLIESAESPRFYVRMQCPNGISEYECSTETYFQCGEGVTGEAEIQGKWLGKFTPYIGSAT